MEAASEKHDHHVVARVNNKPVRLSDHKVSGLDLKQAAINQGVNIKVNYALYRLKGDHQKPVADDQVINVRDNEEFRCVSGDDNS
ncbi:MAG: multiubiquitin domain-containing protein [Polyangiaceae bacterium]